MLHGKKLHKDLVNLNRTNINCINNKKYIFRRNSLDILHLAKIGLVDRKITYANHPGIPTIRNLVKLE